MKTITIASAQDLKAFYDFAKLHTNDQKTLLNQEGLFLDMESDKETFTRVYFLNGFFVEEVTNRELNEVLEIIPFKHGYRIGKFIEAKRERLFATTVRLTWCAN